VTSVNDKLVAGGEELLTRAQAADYLKVSLRTIDRLARSGDLTKLYVTRWSPRIRQGDLEGLLRAVRPARPNQPIVE